MSLKLALDILMVLLLAPTLVYAYILNRRLKTLRSHRKELVRLIEAFNQATGRAEAGIPRLREVSEKATEDLQAQVEKARTLRDDLAFMVERADEMANRLENGVREGRGKTVRKDQPAAPADEQISKGSAPAVSDDAGPLFSGPVEGAIRSREEADPDDPDYERSEAERELLKALRSVK